MIHDYVNFVWFDALTNYISFIGYDPAAKDFSAQPAAFREKWPALHIIGKDILIPAHGIYWPIMLHALGFPDEQMPKFLVHGWWNISGTKMSKSLGNVVDPNALADKYGVEALRYYLMSDIVDRAGLRLRRGSTDPTLQPDLANSLGNLLNRSLNMSVRFLQEEGAKWDSDDPASQTIKGEAEKMISKYRSWTDKYSIDAGLTAAGYLVTRCNQIIDRDKPWEIAKSSSKKPTLSSLLYSLAESLRIIAILISPVLPKAGHGIFDQLNWKMEPELTGKEARFSLAEVEWGRLPVATSSGNQFHCSRASKHELWGISRSEAQATCGKFAAFDNWSSACAERSVYITADTLQTLPVSLGERQALHPQSAMSR